jgi:hypothetical protein
MLSKEKFCYLWNPATIWMITESAREEMYIWVFLLSQRLLYFELSFFTIFHSFIQRIPREQVSKQTFAGW